MKGIIVCSFGSTYRDAYQRSVGKFYELIKKEYPDYYVCEAYSSEIVRKRILQRDGENIFNITEALKHMEAKGIKEINVLMIFVIEGHEYNKVLDAAKAYNDDNRLKIKFTKGLLTDDVDSEEVGEVLSEISGERATVYMGHGSDHSQDLRYANLQAAIDAKKWPVYIGTVEGGVELDDIVERLRAEAVEEIDLLPFMIVAGDHAENDMASDEEDSWKSVLETEGYRVNAKVKGLLEFEEVQKIFLRNLKNIL